MPLYYFQITGRRQLEEPVVVELADDAAAKRLAMISFGEELQEADHVFWADENWQLVVSDANENPVCSINMTGTSPAYD